MFHRPLRPVRVPNSRMTQSLPDYNWDPETHERRYGDCNLGQRAELSPKWKNESTLVKMYR